MFRERRELARRAARASPRRERVPASRMLVERWGAPLPPGDRGARAAPRAYVVPRRAHLAERARRPRRGAGPARGRRCSRGPASRRASTFGARSSPTRSRPGSIAAGATSSTDGSRTTSSPPRRRPAGSSRPPISRRGRRRIATPLVGTYRGWRVETMPPPSRERPVLLQMLGVLEGHDVASMDRRRRRVLPSARRDDEARLRGPRTVHRRSGARRRSRSRRCSRPHEAPRSVRAFDPGSHVRARPLRHGGARARRPRHRAHQRRRGRRWPSGSRRRSTSPSGRASSPPASGILLNDEMDDFATTAQRRPTGSCPARDR